MKGINYAYNNAKHLKDHDTKRRLFPNHGVNYVFKKITVIFDNLTIFVDTV